MRNGESDNEPPKNRNDELTDAEYELLEVTALHEAGHAVMRRILRYPCTTLFADIGGGFCDGTGELLPPADNLKITLAGYAAEYMYPFQRPNIRASIERGLDPDNDLMQALGLVRDFGVRLELFREGEERDLVSLLEEQFEIVRKILSARCDLVSELADQLVEARVLTAQEVASILDRYEANLKSSGT